MSPATSLLPSVSTTSTPFFPPSKINHHRANLAAVFCSLSGNHCTAWNRSLPPLPLPPAVRARPRHQGLSAQTFSFSISPSPSSVVTSVAQDTRHLSFSRHPHLCRFDPSTPIPNGTDTCQTFRALITISDVPIRLSTGTPEIVPGPYQPARTCARLARFMDPLIRNAWRSLSTRGHGLDDQNEDDGG